MAKPCETKTTGVAGRFLLEQRNLRMNIKEARLLNDSLNRVMVTRAAKSALSSRGREIRGTVRRSRPSTH